MELLLDVPYFHSGKATCSLVCHVLRGSTPWYAIFCADLLLGVPYFLMELLLGMSYFHSGKATCSLVCHVFMADRLLGVPYFFDI
jgi:hypothetical protein